MFKLLLAVVKGGKTKVAMAALLIVFLLNKYFGVQADETAVAEVLAQVLGAVGVLHGIWKSETVQGVVAGIKAKQAAKI